MTARDDRETAAFGVERSLGGRRWRLRRAEERVVALLAGQFGLPDLVARVLAGRGIPAEAAAEFLNPSLRDSLPDPYALRDMKAAAERAAAAVVAGERIAVFGDYDVDGATSSALLARFFAAVGGRCEIYIPDRLSEGYGPNAPALRKLAAGGVSLVITVDCGTLAHRPLAAAAEAGLEVIVVDHHKAETRLPEAVAIVNPNRLDEDGALGGLAAVGVAFLLTVAINRALRGAGWYRDGRAEPDLLQWLDLVALGTVCDMVPLTGLNRALVAQGLKVMARRRNTGLAALADVAGLDRPPEARHLGFLLGPRVNAGGRVGESALGATLLASDDPALCRSIAGQLDRHNGERRELEARVFDAALAEIGATTPESLVFAAGKGWHPGVIGIVASRLVERFGLPGLVIAIDEDGVAKGSARAIAGVDIGAAIIAAMQEGLVEQGGGHAMAAGLTARAERLDDLRDFLTARLASRVETARAGRTLELDGALAVRGAQPEIVARLDALAPFGIGNPAPRFVLPEVTPVRADIVGQDHVRLICGGADGGRIKAIAFRAADSELGAALLGGVGQRFHLAGRLACDDWSGTPRVELTVEDAARA